MNLLPLQQRESLAERMDAPDVPAAQHHLALAGLARINRSSRTAARIAQPILRLAQREKRTRLSLLDIACGGGDVPVAVACHLRQSHIDVDLTLTDRSPIALDLARQTAARHNIAATTIAGEAPSGLPDGPFDVVTNSLFLHHLTARQVVQTLTAMHTRARRMIVISDLRRSPAAWLLAWSACRILSRSPIVHYDGPVSVRCAWTIAELRAMLAQTPLHNARVSRSWPMRMLLTWQPEHADA